MPRSDRAWSAATRGRAQVRYWGEKTLARSQMIASEQTSTRADLSTGAARRRDAWPSTVSAAHPANSRNGEALASASGIAPLKLYEPNENEAGATLPFTTRPRETSDASADSTCRP